MFLRSQLSILGMYNYDNTIFDSFSVPSKMDRDTAIIEILSQCAELELVYPDLETMRTLINNWTKAELPQWERAYKDMTIEYNPIWNVDGTETETITRELSGNTSDVIKGTTSSSSEGTSAETTTTNTSGTTDTTTEAINSTVGYNSSSWTNADKTNTTGEDKSTASGTETSNTSNDSSTSSTNNETRDGSNAETETITTEKVRGGNIGVTMTQQMLNADLDLLTRLNPYQFIVDSFKRRFCLLVY